MPAGGRRRARIVALQALYEADSSEHKPLEALEQAVARERLSKEGADFARDLIQGVLDRKDEIDGIIATAAPAWPLEQMAPVDRNILRLAIREMLGDNGAPVRVVVNEAVELAKSFGSQSSARFVNGVLGSVDRQRSGESTEQPAVGKG